MITAVGVVVPAHNEQSHIVDCLRSLRRAVAATDRELRVAVTVVLDRCTDDTAPLVAAELAGWPRARALTLAERPLGTGVGQVRAAGMADVLRRLGPVSPAEVWLLSTDADTVVPPSWVRDQLRYARAGAHAVAGLAELRDDSGLSPQARVRYRALVDAAVQGATHGHVYGANLGVRADAYLRCGGFPRAEHSEDHRLWRALRDRGYRLAQPTRVRVRTSARLWGRAEGGLAELLRTLPGAA